MALRSVAGWLLLSLGLSVAGAAQADSWRPPRLKVVASNDGEALARINPGGFNEGKRPDVTLYAYDDGEGQYSLTQRFKLDNPLAPVDVLLTGQGELVTLDEWAQVGRGIVLAVYSADGKRRYTRTLAQLLGEEPAGKAPQSVSSTWWRCRKPELSWGDRLLLLTTYDNGRLEVELSSGEVKYQPGTGKCE